MDVRGTLLNTGAETIVGINFLQAFTGTLGPHITNWAWNASFWDDYNNASVAIGVLGAGGVYSGSVAPGNEMRVRIPEPSAAALAAVALPGCALVRRRRPMDAH